ncbi:MAG: hypothetical protein OXR72_14825 [Gemmatimonadota bacterium]|nr:hypothetical protein [Gemmatimonadota bacterium]
MKPPTASAVAGPFDKPRDRHWAGYGSPISGLMTFNKPNDAWSLPVLSLSK